ncbi:GNAT family N-acetyltransferase [Bradyrhizobium erythrophlei]|uniref:GNAT family N-acetyltransferase n=1 Tax=Bradyrhizobium erythrophlei TaxID=1437360 RepID=UPI0035EA352F
MHSPNSQASLATDRVLLRRMTGPEPSHIAALSEAGLLRPLDRGGSDRPNAARFAATLERLRATVTFALEAAGTGDLLGLTGFSAIEADEKRVTLAPIWTIAGWDDLALASHVLHLMTRYAFEVLAVERCEAHLDWRLRNMLDLYTSLGFRCEGRLRAYFAADTCASADAAVLSVVRAEWQQVAQRQRKVLAGEDWRHRLPSDRLP